MGLDVFGRALSTCHHAPRGPPGIGINLTKDGHYDMLNKKITNLGIPQHVDDGIPLGMLIEKLKPIYKKLDELEKWKQEVETGSARKN